MKKSICLLLCMAMLSLPVISSAARFTDTVGQPCEEAVNTLADRGIVNGKADGIYDPNGNLTRAEMVAIILRAYGGIEAEMTNAFVDVPSSHWAFIYVEQAKAMGIINGVSETEFAPDAPVTYEQAVKMTVEAMEKGDEAKEKGGWPDGYMMVAKENGILAGTEQEQTAPINRGNMAIIVYNSLLGAGSNADTVSYMQDIKKSFPKLSDDYKWILEDKLIGTYTGTYALCEGERAYEVEDALNIGINTIVFKTLDMKIKVTSPESFREVIEKSLPALKEYKKEGKLKKAFFGISWAENDYVSNTEHGVYHPGVVETLSNSAPCPNSREYWDEAMLSRLKILAEYPEIDGVEIDFEMYSTGISGYTGPCYCDDCFSEYIKEKNLGNINVKKEERSAYIIGKGETQQYEDWYYASVASHCAHIREEILKINPHLMIAVLPGHFFFKGCDGFGTQERPLLSLSEAEYWGGLQSFKENIAEINENKRPIIYIGGLYVGGQGMNFDFLERDLEIMPMYTGGYWLYGFNKIKSANPAGEEQDKWYNTIKKINDELPDKIKNNIVPDMIEYDIESIKIPKIAGEEPTEEEWANAPITDAFENNHLGREYTKYTNQTYAKMLYSDKYLYIRTIAMDNEMENVKVGKPQAHDSASYRSNDCIDFAIRYEGEEGSIHTIIDTDGTVYDSYSSAFGSENASYNFADVESSIKLYDDRWELDAKLPVSLNGDRTLKKGDILRVNIYRTRQANKTLDEWVGSGWTPCYGQIMIGKGLWGYVHLD